MSVPRRNRRKNMNLFKVYGPKMFAFVEADTPEEAKKRYEEYCKKFPLRDYWTGKLVKTLPVIAIEKKVLSHSVSYIDKNGQMK